jgi:hypothetical protein
MASRAQRRASSTDLWFLAWRLGGPSQRSFSLLAALAPPLSGGVMVVAMFFLYARNGFEAVFKLFYVGFIAIAAWPAFQRAIYAPMRGPAFWRAKIARGWVPPAAQDFYEELARYKQERGVDGQLPGDVAWGRAYFLVYLGAMAFAILLTWSLLSWPAFAIVVVFSLLEFPLAFACMYAYGRRNRRMFDRAVREGYPFSSFRLGALHRLQP